MGAAYIDNDILHKLSAYGLLQDLLSIRPLGGNDFFMLGAARYIVAKKLQKKPPLRGAEVSLAEFESALAQISAIEPTNEEVRLAADLEYAAQQLNVDFDPGESLLCAALLLRRGEYIFTGDKRAVLALQALLDADAVPAEVRNRVACLEQLFLLLLECKEHAEIRSAVCREQLVDRALANCFSCCATTTSVESWREGLASYIRDLLTKAPGVLLAYNC